MTGKQVQIELMKVAAPLAAGLVSRLPQLTAADPVMADPTTQAEDTEGWRFFETYYAAALKCIYWQKDKPYVGPGDGTIPMWTEPPAIGDSQAPGGGVPGAIGALGTLSPSVLALLGGLISKIPATASITTAADLLKALQGVAPAPAGPVTPGT
jgi:hypothetical protein